MQGFYHRTVIILWELNTTLTQIISTKRHFKLVVTAKRSMKPQSTDSVLCTVTVIYVSMLSLTFGSVV